MRWLSPKRRKTREGKSRERPGAIGSPMLDFARLFPAVSCMGDARFSLIRILADGRFHSGESLGRSLGVSGSGVRDLVSRLEDLGLSVSKVRGRGFRLAEDPDLIETGLLEARLKEASPELRLDVVDECPSTNTLLAERAAAGAPHGAVLVCEHQSAGRGRRGNLWVSRIGGSLAFSMLWRFAQGAGALGGLSLAVAVGAARALEQLGIRGVEVKWPNDLVLKGRKLGGILIELTGDVRGPSAAVIGVGINVRLDRPMRGRIGSPAADIAGHGGTAPTRTALLGALLPSIAESLARFSREGFVPFREEWLRLHAWRGRRVALSTAGRRVTEGKIVGIAEDGALMLASAKGVERFHSGELSLRLR